MSTTAVILAAGMGKRMKSHLPKVLHPVLGRPMVQRAAETAEKAGVSHVVVVAGHGREGVIPILQENGWNWAVQEEQLGTAHAVQCALPLPEECSEVVVLLGDVPLLRPETVAMLLEARRRGGVSLAVLTTTPPDVTGYGRIVLDSENRISRIVEEKDASPEEKGIRIINTGIMAFSREALLRVLPLIGSGNAQGEFYLTDAVSILAEEGDKPLSVFTENWREVAGVNNPLQLTACTSVMKKRIVQEHLLAGVVIPDPDTVWIEDGVTIGKAAVIGRNCTLSGDTIVGPAAVVGQGSVLDGVVVEAGAVLDEYTVIKAEE